MDAAFILALTAPPAGAPFLAGRDAVGARHAADRQESVGLERMGGEAAHGEFVLDACAAVAGEGIDLDAPADRLDHANGAARAAMVALAPGDRRGETGERALERLDLAQPAAGIGVAVPQRAIRVAARHLARIGRDD